MHVNLNHTVLSRLALILVLFSSMLAWGQEPKTAEKITLDNIELYYETYGEGPPLLLLHGWTQSSQFWKPYISELSKNYKFYVLDQRGHGKSAPLTNNFSIQQAALDIQEFISALTLKRPKAIGLSFGGLVLLELCQLDANLLDKMILISATSQYNGADNNSLEAFSFDNLPPEFVEELRKTHPQGDEQLKALFNPKLNYRIDLVEEDLKKISSKTLIIHGDRDEVLGIEPAVVLHKALSNSSLWIVPEAGHIPISNENKAQFLSISLQFLSQAGANKEDKR